MTLKTLEEYAQKVRKMYPFEGYFERFFEIMAENGSISGATAFELLEKEHFAVFGANRYADYGVFRVMRRRYVIRIQLKAKSHKKRR
jgi:hypothetical protein